jgi:hypothetical protein
VNFAPGFCDGGAKYFLAVLVGHPNKQSAALFALDAREFGGDLTGMIPRVVDGATRPGFLIVDFGMIAEMEVEAVHRSSSAVWLLTAEAALCSWLF